MRPHDEGRECDRHRDAPPAERRSVTVLFADAKGSTALTEQIGDEEMYRLMQRCVNLMQSVVDRNGGTVTQFRGDGVMALFGAPRATEQAAVKAATAALEIQEGLRRQREESSGAEQTGCQFRVGLNTGPVVVGRIGEETLVDYTAIGDTANVAARMEQAAASGEVYLSEATWRMVQDYVDCESVGPLDLAGKEEPVTAYRAVRRRPVKDRLEAAAARGLSPFVGRDSELGLLRSLVDRLDDGNGRVVVVSGEAGIGKSRILLEMIETVPAAVTQVHGRSSSADRRAPWHVVVDLLRDAFDIGEGVESDVVAGRIDETSQNWAADVQPAAAYLKWLLGVEVSALEGLDPMELRAGVFEALVATVRDLASRSPMVITVEDLHWADESSLAALRALARSIGDVPVLLVATTRPDGGGALGELPWSSVVALEALSREDTAGLVAGAVSEPLSAGAASLVADRSGGNPLFVEELTAALLEAGVLVSVDGEIGVGDNPGSAGLPATLHDVVLARIDHLDGDARDALQLASVIGREFTWRILDRIATAPSGLDGHLSELESLELIHQQAWFPELAYLFKHAVVHEVTYSTLLDERRRSLHAVVARATEELYANQLTEHCESLARHWLAAGEELRALPHLARAAERAMAGSSMDRAQEALAQAALIADSSGDREGALEYRLLRMQALIVGDDMDEAVAEVDRAVVLAEAIGLPEKRATLHWWKANVLMSAHEFEECEREARAGIALAESLGDAGTQMMVACSSALGACVGVLGRLDEFDEIEWTVRPLRARVAVDLSVDGRIMAGLVANWRAQWSQEWIDAVSEPVSSAWTRVLALWEGGLSYAGMGCYGDALDRLEVALVEAVRVDFEYGRGRILNTLGWIHGELGDLAGAASLNLESLEVALALAHPDIEIEANARLNLADDGLRAGDLDTAVQHVEALRRVIHAPTPYERFGHWRFSMRWRCVLAEIELARGNPEAAIQATQRSLDDAECTNSRKYEVRARRHLGEARAMLGASGRARREVDASLALAEAIGNPPQLWRSLVAQARLGDRDAAHRAVDTIDDVVKSLGDRPLATSLADSRERREAVALTQQG